MSEPKICPGCEKEVPVPYQNYCTWECHILAAEKSGGEKRLPNGLPVRCITGDGLMLECEHGDHPTYIFPVTVGRERFVERNDEAEWLNDAHALIYTDGKVALTMYECCYALWSLRDGRVIDGPSWTRGQRLSNESLDKVRALGGGASGGRPKDEVS